MVLCIDFVGIKISFCGGKDIPVLVDISDRL